MIHLGTRDFNQMAKVLYEAIGPDLVIVRFPAQFLFIFPRSFLVLIFFFFLSHILQLVIKSNSGFFATHDGVDVGGDRMAKEVCLLLCVFLFSFFLKNIFICVKRCLSLCP